MIADCEINGALETLDIISEQGFNAFFTMPVSKEYCHKIKERADQLGVKYEFIHATWDKINELWTSEQTPQIMLDLNEQIDLCASIGVDKLIVHLSSGDKAPFVNDLGFKRLDALVDHAKSKNVKLVFENQRKLYSLACVLERYKDCDTVGFCFDSGHEKCFSKNVRFLDFWADRVVCTHLHDNCGKHESDDHKLPFEGVVEFDYVMDRLNKAGYSGSLMLEVPHTKYPNLTKKEFFKKAYKSVEKLSKM